MREQVSTSSRILFYPDVCLLVQSLYFYKEFLTEKQQEYFKFSEADWPRPVSRKTSEDGVKKSFLFEPQASLKDFSRQA